VEFKSGQKFLLIKGRNTDFHNGRTFMIVSNPESVYKWNWGWIGDYGEGESGFNKILEISWLEESLRDGVAVLIEEKENEFEGTVSRLDVIE